MAVPDRLSALLTQAPPRLLSGIDFVYVHADQVRLDVYFHVPPGDVTPSLETTITQPSQAIIDATGERIAVTAVAWDDGAAGRRVLRIFTATPGGFHDYRLRLMDGANPARPHPSIDPYYNGVAFSFKANCPREIDCEPPAHECPPDERVDFPVDYSARDFWSYRRVLLEYAAARYPDWQDRLPADVGVMLAEVMSSLGDEASYYQDRVAREATLETATQRRSVRRHARLVDYVIHDGLGARGWLNVIVPPNKQGNVPAGTPVVARGGDGAEIVYELGTLEEQLQLPKKQYPVDGARSATELVPHVWDEAATCLGYGATSMHVRGKRATALQPIGERHLLLQTVPTDGRPARKHVVRLVAAVEERDPLLALDLTRITWADEDALPFELDLEILEVHGNLVPITAGRTITGHVAVRAPLVDAGADSPVPTVERTGPDGSVVHLVSLPGTDTDGLVHLGAEPRVARPEIHVAEVAWTGVGWSAPTLAWTWRRALIGTDSSLPRSSDYTLDDGQWRRIVGWHRPTGDVTHVDYASGDGMTVRFGDGEFGKVPAAGTYFRVMYRVGNGRRGNVGAGALSELKLSPLPDFVSAVWNPLPIENGEDPETLDEIRASAPEAFRRVTHRAVRPEDYAEVAERLPWVQRAGAAFRWTGSWLTAFVTPDPRDAPTLAADRALELERHVDRFRQTGRDVIVRPPRYADLDLEIAICVAASAYRGDVAELVMASLVGGRSPWQPRGFFHPDRFTFGTPLDRSALEAWIQAVPGVKAVEGMKLRRRGWFEWRGFDELRHQVAVDEVVRVMNDPTHPDRGSVKLVMRGGA